ncbi:MAG TPA: hypothetical protein VFW40_13400, partial [Capsulimonadaceae bacterium]|nr:hypothetical protein [Capsulimonadaceae bacterium]
MENRSPDQILASIKSSAAIRAVEGEFLTRALNSLAVTGLNALEFLAANPGLSAVQLAARLKGGCNAIGLTIAIFREAERTGLVRPTAKSLLIGKILTEFPDGWSSAGGIHPAVKLGWSALVMRHVSDPLVGQYALLISKELTANNPPPEGWKPA